MAAARTPLPRGLPPRRSRRCTCCSSRPLAASPPRRTTRVHPRGCSIVFQWRSDLEQLVGLKPPIVGLLRVARKGCSSVELLRLSRRQSLSSPLDVTPEKVNETNHVTSGKANKTNHCDASRSTCSRPPHIGLEGISGPLRNDPCQRTGTGVQHVPSGAGRWT